MSPARQHRERFLAAAAAKPGLSPTIVFVDEGGQTPAPPVPEITPALEHRLSHGLESQSGEGETELADGVDPAGAQVQLRLAHDLRRLKEIQSVERKVETKREMIGEYAAWIDGILDGSIAAGLAADVLPTIMVWAIDIGDWRYALRLADHVLEHGIALPSRYQRSAPALITEDISEAALKLQAKGEPFPLEVLEEVELLTTGADMHDEIRAKLMKALGSELARAAEQLDPRIAGTAPDASLATFTAAAERALGPLRRAQELNPRAGAKDRIKRLERGIALAAKEQAGTPPAP